MAEKAQADAQKRESAALEKVSALKKQLEDTMVEGLGRDCNKHTT